MKTMIIAIATLITVTASAQTGRIAAKSFSVSFRGGEGVGGGDPCEDQIKIIREDLLSWIKKGGPQGLKLSQGLKAEDYASSMQQQLAAAKITCVGPGDNGFPVEVYGTSKVCRFEKPRWGAPAITCSRGEFMNMNESDQYVLIHHEYAGLAGVENPQKDDSDYTVSNQISSFLVNQVVQRLTVKRHQEGSASGWRTVRGVEAAGIARSLQDSLASTKFTDCDVAPTEVSSPVSLVTCEGGSYYYNKFNITSKTKPVLGFWNMPIGNYTCEKRPEDIHIFMFNSYTFMFKSTSGQPTVWSNQTTDGTGKVGEFLSKTILDSVYQMDASESRLLKVTFTQSKTVQENKGTIGNPNWQEVKVPTSTLECHAALP